MTSTVVISCTVISIQEWVARRDAATVIEHLVAMRAWLVARNSADVLGAWTYITRTSYDSDLDESERVRTRLLASVKKGHPLCLRALSQRATPSSALKWIDTVIAHDRAQLRSVK